MDIVKGITILGGVVAFGSSLALAPVLTVSTGILTTTYTVNGLAAAGAAAATAAGVGIGKVAGETGGALVIQGLDAASQKLVDRLSPENGRG